MKKKNGKAQSASNQKMVTVKFSKLKDRHGNRVGPCQRAEAIADSFTTNIGTLGQSHQPKIDVSLLAVIWAWIQTFSATKKPSLPSKKWKKGKAPGHDKINIDTIT